MPGPFYFAWVDAETDFDPEVHAVEDESVYSMDLIHNEGEFPSCDIEIRNPRVGLLAPGRKRWAWLSYHDGSSAGVTPVFYGRLVGIPSDMQGSVVKLTFIARPRSWDAQRAALAATMRVAPYYDPVWISADARNDPDSVLEGRPVLWHIDRVTHEVTPSLITEGEDGLVNYAGNFNRDSLSMTYSTAPGRRVGVTGVIRYTQHAAGTVDVTARVNKAFAAAGSSGGKNLIASLTGQGLMEDWPVDGGRIGGGWTFGPCTITRVDGLLSEQGYQTVVVRDGTIINFPEWTLKQTTTVTYDVSRTITETLTFTVEADCQDLLTEPGDEELITLKLASDAVADPIDPGGLAPLRDPARGSYFDTDRGAQSVANLVARARAELLARARAVAVTFDVRFEDGLHLSCRKNASIADPRLPGGTAAGKIIAYELTADGDGARGCRVTIGCMIGHGGSVTSTHGTPDYVSEGPPIGPYVDDGYQTRTGQLVMPIDGEITISALTTTDTDYDGFDMLNMTPERVLIPGENTEGPTPPLFVLYGHDQQGDIVASTGYGATEAIAALSKAYTTVQMNLIPLSRGPFIRNLTLETSDLVIPKTLDLEAAS